MTRRRCSRAYATVLLLSSSWWLLLLLLLLLCAAVLCVTASPVNGFDGFARDVPAQLSQTTLYTTYYDNHDAVALAVAAAVRLPRNSDSGDSDSSNNTVVLYGSGGTAANDGSGGDNDGDDRVVASVLLPVSLTTDLTDDSDDATTLSLSHACAWSPSVRVSALQRILQSTHMPTAVVHGSATSPRRGVALVLLPRRPSPTQRVDAACLLDAVDAYNDAIADTATSSSPTSQLGVRVDAVLMTSQQLRRRRPLPVDALVVADVPHTRSAAVLLYRDNNNDDDDENATAATGRAIAAWQRAVNAAVTNARRWALGVAFPHYIVEVRQPMRLLLPRQRAGHGRRRRDSRSEHDKDGDDGDDDDDKTTAPTYNRSCFAHDLDDGERVSDKVTVSCVRYGGVVVFASSHENNSNSSSADTRSIRTVLLLAPSTTTTLTHSGGATAAADGVVSGVVVTLAVAAASAARQDAALRLYVAFVPGEALGRIGSTHLVHAMATRTAGAASHGDEDDGSGSSSSYAMLPDMRDVDAVVTVEQVGHAASPLHLHVDARVDGDNNSSLAAVKQLLLRKHDVRQANTTQLPHAPTTSFVEHYCRGDGDCATSSLPLLLTLSRYDTHYRSPGVYTAADDAQSLQEQQQQATPYDVLGKDDGNDDDEDNKDAGTRHALAQAGNALLDVLWLLQSSRRDAASGDVAGEDGERNEVAARVDAVLLRRLWRCLARRRDCEALSLSSSDALDFDTATMRTRHGSGSGSGNATRALRASERALLAALQHIGMRPRTMLATPPPHASSSSPPLYVRSTWPSSVGVRMAMVGTSTPHTLVLLLAVAWCAVLAAMAARCGRRA